jgi:hypothetical protein
MVREFSTESLVGLTPLMQERSFSTLSISYFYYSIPFNLLQLGKPLYAGRDSPIRNFLTDSCSMKKNYIPHSKLKKQPPG